MSRTQRIGLVVAALVVAVVAFVVAQPGDDDDGSAPSATTTQTETTQTSETDSTEPAPPPEPEVTRIQVRGGVVSGGVQEIRAEKDEVVRIVVTSDAPDEIHLHGYDIEREAEPGRPARFRFKADIEGAFELESHAAEHAGNEPLIARLLVGPS